MGGQLRETLGGAELAAKALVGGALGALALSPYEGKTRIERLGETIAGEKQPDAADRWGLRQPETRR